MNSEQAELETLIENWFHSIAYLHLTPFTNVMKCFRREDLAYLSKIADSMEGLKVLACKRKMLREASDGKPYGNYGD